MAKNRYINRLVAIVSEGYAGDEDEFIVELYYKSRKHAEEWVEDNRDYYQSFHYVIAEVLADDYPRVYIEDEYWDEDDEDDEDNEYNY